MYGSPKAQLHIFKQYNIHRTSSYNVSLYKKREIQLGLIYTKRKRTNNGRHEQLNQSYNQKYSILKHGYMYIVYID